MSKDDIESIRQAAKEWIGSGRQDNFYQSWRSSAEEVITGNYETDRPKGAVGFIWDKFEEKRQITKRVLSAIAASPQTQGRLFRGIRLDKPPKLGDEFDDALVSWTSKHDLAVDFAKGGGGGTVPVIFSIYRPKALPITGLAKPRDRVLRSADEHLLSGRFRVAKVQEDMLGTYHVKLEVVDGASAGKKNWK